VPDNDTGTTESREMIGWKGESSESDDCKKTVRDDADVMTWYM